MIETMLANEGPLLLFAFATLIGAAALTWRSRRSDYRLGWRAFEDGLPMNIGWSRQMQDGWVAAWEEQSRARRGMRSANRRFPPVSR